MKSIVIPDYLVALDIVPILTYTENNEMIPERMAARCRCSHGAGIVIAECDPSRLPCGSIFISMDSCGDHSVLSQGIADNNEVRQIGTDFPVKETKAMHSENYVEGLSA